MTDDIIAVVISEFVIIFLWIISYLVVLGFCEATENFSFLTTFNICMALITALPPGALLFKYLNN